MPLEISKFIPAEMRIQMARELIREEGIRPLARRIGVNPKTVYKYKEGSAHPRDDTMSRIMAVMKEEEPDLYERYLDRLWTGFSDALGPSRVSEMIEKEKTGNSRARIVGQKPTERKVSLMEISGKMGITSPFEYEKLRKVLGVVQEEPGVTLDEIARCSGLSLDAAERYAEMLSSDGFLRESSPGVYELTRPVLLEEEK